MKVLLRKWHGRFDAMLQASGGAIAPGGNRSVASLLPGIGLMVGVLAIAVIAMLALPILFDHAIANIAALPLAGFFVGETRSLAQKRADLSKLYIELDKASEEIKSGVSQTRGEEIEAKAKEAEALQAEVDQAERIQKIASKGRELAGEPAMPVAKDSKENKGRGAGVGSDGTPVVGYVSVGDLFVGSPEFKSYMDNLPQIGVPSQRVNLKTLHEKLVPVTEKMVESKAIPTVTNVIQVDRVADIVRTPATDRLVLRDVLQVAATDSNSIEYLVISAVTNAAAPVAENASKPESTMTVTNATAPVRTLAHWMPITEQQLQDVPGLRAMVDNELLYGLRKVEENQIMYGSGAGENLQGILTLAGVPLITRTAPSATQNLDRVKIGATDIMVAGGEPNAVVVHPIDWEQIVLLKGTDNRYVWAMIESDNGPRVWGMSVVETVATKNPANLQRYLLVGDFLRGATLYDRQQANVSVGFVNDDFIKNRRTIRAEERVALAIKRPTYFAKYETATAV